MVELFKTGNISQRKSSSVIGLTIVLLVVGFILLAWLLVWPEYGKFTESRARLDSIKTEQAAKLQTTKDVDQLLPNYKSKKQQLDLVQQALPQAPKIPELLANIESLVSQSSMKLSLLKITEEDSQQQQQSSSQAPNQEKDITEKTSGSQVFAAPKIVDLKIDLTASGTYDKFLVLLNLLEHNLRLFEVRSLSSQAASGESAKGGSANNTDFSFVIATFYQK